MEDDPRKGGFTLEQLLAIRPDDVLAMFLNDIKRYTGSIESAVPLLSDKDIAHEHDRIIDILKRSITGARDMYDYYLIYLEKLQEIRQSDAGHD
jgi:hypothetical protein